MEKDQYLGSNICYGPKKKVSITIATFLHEIESSESTYGKKSAWTAKLDTVTSRKQNIIIGSVENNK